MFSVIIEGEAHGKRERERNQFGFFRSLFGWAIVASEYSEIKRAYKVARAIRNSPPVAYQILFCLSPLCVQSSFLSLGTGAEREKEGEGTK